MSADLALEYLSWLLLGAGCLLLLIGAAGLLRLPDFYTRLHPAGIVDTGAQALILAGLLPHAGWTLVGAKLVLILLLQMVTTPTACHATARAALAAGLRPKTADS